MGSQGALTEAGFRTRHPEQQLQKREKKCQEGEIFKKKKASIVAFNGTGQDKTGMPAWSEFSEFCVMASVSSVLLTSPSPGC